MPRIIQKLTRPNTEKEERGVDTNMKNQGDSGVLWEDPMHRDAVNHLAVITHNPSTDDPNLAARVLAICNDGPAEFRRVYCVDEHGKPEVPQIGDLFRIENAKIFNGKIQHQPMTEAKGIWIEAGRKWFIYRVKGYLMDKYGVVVDLRFRQEVNP